MDKQNVYEHIMEGSSDTSYDMDQPGGHYAKCNKPAPKRQILCDSPYMSELAESKSKRQTVEQWIPGAGEEEDRELVLKGYRDSVSKDKKSY